MGKFLKILGGLAAIGAVIGAVFAIKKRKEMEEYDYEEFDDCDCDCDCDCCCEGEECDCDESCDCCCEGEECTCDESSNSEEATDDVEADLDKVEDAVEEIDK